jgi:hypothetical protein
MIRNCNSKDPNLVDPGSGHRGNCGRSFDDVTHLLTCPHEPINKGIATELVTYMASSVIMVDREAAMRYRFYTDPDRVIIHCEPCAGIEHKTSPHTHWSSVRGPVDALAWMLYHESTTSHLPLLPKRDAMACNSHHAAYGRCIGHRGHLPRLHANTIDQQWTDEDAAASWMQPAHAGGPFAMYYPVNADEVARAMAEDAGEVNTARAQPAARADDTAVLEAIRDGAHAN